MDEILQQILKELKELKVGQDDLKASQEELKVSQERIEKKLDSVYEHTAKITEDITYTNMKIDNLADDLDFLKHKEHQTEEDLFKLKKNLKIIR